LTVLQSGHELSRSEQLTHIALLARSYVSSIVDRSPLMHAWGLNLAEAVFQLSAMEDLEKGRSA
jgi:hypothetical protein